MIAFLVGIELRRRWRSVALLALLVALVVGTVLAAVAGGRRSLTAYDRYAEVINPVDLLAFGDPEVLAALDDLPAVNAVLPLQVAAIFPAPAPDFYFPMVISLDGRIPDEYLRYRVVEGRLPDPSAPLEVALGEGTAARLAAGPGDEIPMLSLTPAAVQAFQGGELEPDGPEFALEVVGIVRDQGDILGRANDLAFTFLTPAFGQRYGPDELGSFGEGAFVALADGADAAEVTRAVAGEKVQFDTSFSGDLVRRQANPTLRAIATALYVLAAVAALAGLATVAHVAARMAQASALDDRALSALGVARIGRWTRRAVPGLLAVLVGTPLGVAAAIAASRWFPIGVARRAEPDPGIHVDGLALLAGGASALVVGCVVVGVLGALNARAEMRTAPLSRLGRAAAGVGAPPPVVTGLAFASGTSNGSPGRAAIGGTMLGVLGVIAATVFAASLDRLVADPSLYGWGWDLNIDDGHLSSAALLTDEDLEGVAEIVFQLATTLDGMPDYATVATDVKGHLSPVVVRGAEPHGSDEVALGRDSLERLDKRIGDEVAVDIGAGPQPMRISGVVAFPVPQDGGSSASGAFLTAAAAEDLGFDYTGYCGKDSDPCYRQIAVSLDPGVLIAEVVARYEDPEAGVAVELPLPPGEIERLIAVKQLPRYLAGFLALLAGVAVTYAAGMTARHRRRDLAMLRALGMTARQLRSVLAVQVLVLTVGGVVVGTLLGLVAGRQIWRMVVNSVALPFAPEVPMSALVLIPLATLLLTQLAATFSRRTAGHTKAAIALRAE